MCCLFDSELFVQNYIPEINSHCCMQLYLIHFLCNTPGPGPGPRPRASRPPPLRGQTSQPPGGGAPMAEPAPAARGAPAPRLTDGAPQAG